MAMLKDIIDKKTNRFVQLDLRILSDVRLSPNAKILAAVLISKPESWTPNIQHLAKFIIDPTRKKPKDIQSVVKHVYKALNLLKAAGYLTWERTRNAEGKFEATLWGITDRACLSNEVAHNEIKKIKTVNIDESDVNDCSAEEIKVLDQISNTDNPEVGNPQAENPYTENPHVDKRNVSNIENNSKIEIDSNIEYQLKQNNNIASPLIEKKEDKATCKESPVNKIGESVNQDSPPNHDRDDNDSDYLNQMHTSLLSSRAKERNLEKCKVLDQEIKRVRQKLLELENKKGAALSTPTASSSTQKPVFNNACPVEYGTTTKKLSSKGRAFLEQELRALGKSDKAALLDELLFSIEDAAGWGRKLHHLGEDRRIKVHIDMVKKGGFSTPRPMQKQRIIERERAWEDEKKSQIRKEVASHDTVHMGKLVSGMKQTTAFAIN